ncbi:MAG: 5,10-methenyltetrahydrofolate synthetase [Tremellales sp. Tagirdzhanova-0007]|nr:MAG: 5,10-methenyltetrahydrofolate synthetase [Tremellales sp. Tagirdzhanova-0007]
MHPNVSSLKSSLRKSVLGTLRSLSDAELDQQSQAVANFLVKQPFFTRARSVACYLSMARGELRTSMIVDDLLGRDVKLYTPYLRSSPDSSDVVSPGDAIYHAEMCMLRMYNSRDLAQCPLDKWRIKDPGEWRRDTDEVIKREDVMNEDVGPLDLILLPGVAFDVQCNRLGRGKAYYDRFLASFTSSHRRPLLVALALSTQILPCGEMVPITDSDFRLDGVLSPAGMVWRDGVAL